MMEAVDYAAIAAVLTAFFVPLTFVSMRESVKRQRREIVQDLQTIFDRQPDLPLQEIIPSFEFVKYKYFFERGSSSAHASTPRDFRQYHWLLGSIPLVATTAIFNFFVIEIISYYGLDFDLMHVELVKSPGGTIPLMALVVLSAYAGATLFMLKAFFRAINNFDLSPLSFIGAWVNLMLGVSTAVVFVYGFMRISRGIIEWHETSPALQAVVLLTSFFVGRLPDLANRNLLRAVQLRDFKQEDVDVYKSFTAVPIEIVDGIDSEIRDRLTDFHINAVQNLAAANPLMLFVETPYGVYQIMDWVAQAQLCCSVGPSNLLRLWRLGIRTIFDLERAALDPLCRNTALIFAVGHILLEGETDVNGQSPSLTEAAIIANILIRIDNPHVHRLRQLFIKVADRIGHTSRRLPPSLTCPVAKDPKCLLAYMVNTPPPDACARPT